MLVHVDGDVIAYRAGFAAEHTVYHLLYRQDGVPTRATFDGAKELQAFIATHPEWEPIDYLVEPEIVVEPEEAAIYNVRSMLAAICEDLQIDPETELRVYLSGPTNFRNGVATIKPYKGNRDKSRKPVHAAAIKDYMRRTYNTVTSDGQEADDDMAIAHMATWGVDSAESVIATIDKDLDQIPGLHYNFVRKEGYYITPEAADAFFWQQVISGDATDNVPGIPGWGPIKAKKYVEENSERIFDAVRALYVQGYGEDTADAALLENARLVYIRRRADEWWNPPKGGVGDRTIGGIGESGVRVPEGVSAEERGV